MAQLIDKMTGSVCIHGSMCIPANLTRRDFFMSSLGRRSKPLIRNEPYMSWDLPAVELPDKIIFSRIFFNGEKMDMVTWTVDLPPFGATWADWSLEKEMQIKAYNDALLEHDLGSPPYEFAWGKVVSVYSERDDASLIVIRY